MTKKGQVSFIALMLYLVGFILCYMYADWKLGVIILAMITGNNLEQAARRL